MESSKSKKLTIDYKKLETELQKEIQEDELYWLRNAAKLRSVSQGTSTYEDFRQIVLAAHLKPITKQDKEELERSSKGQVIWNHCAGSSSSTNDDPTFLSKVDDGTKKDDAFLSMPQIPNSKTEFCKCWKSYGPGNYEMKWMYLRIILKATMTQDEKEVGGGTTKTTASLLSDPYEQNALRRIWAEEVPSDIFPDLIQCLLHIVVYPVFPCDMIFQDSIDGPSTTVKDNVKLEDWKDALKTLYIATLSKRHKISLSFFSQEDKEGIEKILAKIQRRMNHELQSYKEIEGETKILVDTFTTCRSGFMQIMQSVSTE